MVSLKDSILLIGGSCDGVTSTRIAKYTLSTFVEQWIELGNLQEPRKGHRAIRNGDRVYVIGGPNNS